MPGHLGKGRQTDMVIHKGISKGRGKVLGALAPRKVWGSLWLGRPDSWARDSGHSAPSQSPWQEERRFGELACTLLPPTPTGDLGYSKGHLDLGELVAGT